MVEYNIVKYCRLCKDRFVVPRSQAKTYYCKNCQKKVDNQLSQKK